MMEKETTRKKPVYSILACSVVFLLLIVLVIKMTHIFSSEIYKNIRESTTENVRSLTSDRAKMLDKTLELLEVQAQTLAVHLSEPDSVITESSLKQFAEMDKDFLRIVAFSADGTAVSSDGIVNEVSKNSEVYRQALAGECGTTDTFIGSMGYKEVNVYAPVYHNSEIAGGVYINLAAETLRSAGGTPIYNSSGYSYLLKRDGTILLAPTSYSFVQIYRNIKDVFRVSQSNQETVDLFMTALENGESGNAVLDFSGNMQIMCFEPLTERDDWYYVSVLPLSLVENNGQAVISLASRMSTLFSLIMLIFLLFMTALVFSTLHNKWKNEINEGRVYKAISENIDTAIFIMDQSTKHIRHAFENTQSILGIPAEKIQGCVLSREWLVQTGLPAGVADMEEEAEQSSQPVTMELKYYNRMLDKEVWMNINISPLLLKGRREYMVAFTDITENKHLMEELRSSMLEAQSASAAKSSFLANMSHDIRTPMNAISGMTDIAMTNIENQERVLDCLKKISLSSRHLKGLINDILDMSKIESGKLSLNSNAAELPEILEGITNIVQIQANEKDQQLIVIVRQVEHESVICDSVRLNQVLLNILANAVKFTPNGGTIRFSVEEMSSDMGPEYGKYRFRVKDSGIGMSKEYQKLIFESFTREKNSRIEKIEGSGLGMAISKWIVDQMNGTIRVFSEPDQGSEFVVTVHFMLNREQPLQNPLSNLSCLLAERDKEVRESAVSVLRMLCARVESASDLEAVLLWAAQTSQSDEAEAMILLGRSILGDDPAETVARIREVEGAERLRIVLVTKEWTSADMSALQVDGVISTLFFKSSICRELNRIMIPESVNPELREDNTLAGLHILLAEDNALNREICITLLESNGVVVEAVEDGRQCLECFLASSPGDYQMILTDIQMPIMNGYESVRRIRESSHADAKTIPILAVTADAFSEDIEAARKAGMDGHISKPIDIAQLIAEIKKHYQKHQEISHDM